MPPPETSGQGLWLPTWVTGRGGHSFQARHLPPLSQHIHLLSSNSNPGCTPRDIFKYPCLRPYSMPISTKFLWVELGHQYFFLKLPIDSNEQPGLRTTQKVSLRAGTGTLRQKPMQSLTLSLFCLLLPSHSSAQVPRPGIPFLPISWFCPGLTGLFCPSKCYWVAEGEVC